MTPPPPVGTLAVDAAGAGEGVARAPHDAATPHAFSARRLLGFLGPGYLIAVGYMDPGNWATDLAGGSRFGYALSGSCCCRA